MDAITFIRGIPNAKMFVSVTHFTSIYCVSITKFNRMFHFSLSIFPDKVFVKGL